MPRHATPEAVEYRKKYNANPVNKARKRLTWIKYLKENNIVYELVTTSWWPNPSSVGFKIRGVR